MRFAYERYLQYVVITRPPLNNEPSVAATRRKGLARTVQQSTGGSSEEMDTSTREKLSELKALKDDGLIDTDEYKAAKRKCLGLDYDVETLEGRKRVGTVATVGFPGKPAVSTSRQRRLFAMGVTRTTMAPDGPVGYNPASFVVPGGCRVCGKHITHPPALMVHERACKMRHAARGEAVGEEMGTLSLVATTGSPSAKDAGEGEAPAPTEQGVKRRKQRGQRGGSKTRVHHSWSTKADLIRIHDAVKEGRVTVPAAYTSPIEYARHRRSPPVPQGTFSGWLKARDTIMAFAADEKRRKSARPKGKEEAEGCHGK